MGTCSVFSEGLRASGLTARIFPISKQRSSVRALFCLMSSVDQVMTIGIEGKSIGKRLVERALPPTLIGVRLPTQALIFDTVA